MFPKIFKWKIFVLKRLAFCFNKIKYVKYFKYKIDGSRQTKNILHKNNLKTCYVILLKYNRIIQNINNLFDQKKKTKCMTIV